MIQLERPFTEEEVIGVFNHLSDDKAVGLDGFFVAFFQLCWGVVKVEIMNTLHAFYEHGTFERSLNATFLALIHKMVGASYVKDFRPINLVRSVYKILAKVLVNRLKEVLGNILTYSKCFHRWIVDCSPMCSEYCVSWIWRKFTTTLIGTSYYASWREMEGLGLFLYLNCVVFDFD